MKTFASLLVAAVIFGAVIVIPSCQSTKSSTATKMLQFNFEKGRGYDYEMIMNMDQEISGQKMQMDMTNYYSMEVTAEEGGIKTITTTFERFKMNMAAGGMNLEVDSDKPLPDFGPGGAGKEKGMKVLSGLLGAIKGRKFIMKVNQEGKILEVKGFEDMARSMVDSLDLDENKKKEMIQGLNQQFNEQSIKDQFERILYIFPNKQVKIGDTWQKTTTPGGGVAGGKYISNYTVTEIEGDMVTLEEKSKIETNAEGVNMDGDITGTIVIDSRSGLVVNADQDMTLKSGKEGKSFEMKTKSKIKGKVRQ